MPPGVHGAPLAAVAAVGVLHDQPHQRVAAALMAQLGAGHSAIAGEVGDRTADDLLAAHRLWSDWLGSGRVRKLAVVAEKHVGG